MPEVAVVPGIDGRKMSKSYGNTIPLFATREEITKAVMSIVTDSSGERPENVYAIHRLLKSENELAPLYAEHAGKYKALKDALVEDLDAFIAPMREEYERLDTDSAMVESVLRQGAESARARADKKLTQIRKAIGVA
jgi:tryptophanyl-tRNA synthetase